MALKTIVLSGINLVDGGALSVYIDCINELLQNGYANNYKIVALVGNKKLFPKDKRIKYVEFPKSKKNWLYRIYYEYIYFYFFSKKIKPYIWLSLHDITPNIVATKRYVYCHNPSPFNRMSIREAKYGWKYYIFSKFYKYLYSLNIHKNTGVIVQQEWMRSEFKKMFNINNIIVARPSLPTVKGIKSVAHKKVIFVYPSFPRYYKNFEVVCKAAKELQNRKSNDYKIFITINGKENRYSKELVEKYKNINSITFCGLLSRQKLFNLYKSSNCLLFMSKLETWGMPIIEFKPTNQAMILADLPYSHDTIGNYNNVSFIEPNDFKGLAREMEKVINGERLGNSVAPTPQQPFARSWKELFKLII